MRWPGRAEGPGAETGGGAGAGRGQVTGSGFVERGMTRVRLRMEGEEDVTVDGEAAEDAVSVTTPQLAAGAWSVAVSVNGDAGEWVDCPVPFTAA